MSQPTWLRFVALAVLAAGALTAAACAQTVNQVLVDPARYRNHEVRLSGSVVDSYSIGDRGVYRIDDHTGQLWVVSDRGVPRRGAQVKITGTVRQGFNLGSIGDRIRLPAGIGSGILLVETSRKAK
jgi:opacity protein-like surface antigen